MWPWRAGRWPCGRLELAGEILQKAVQLTQRTTIDPFIQCWLEDCRLRLWLVQGDFAAADDWAKTCGLKPDGPLSYHFDLNHLNLARWLAVRNRLEDARSLLSRLLLAAGKAGWVQEEIKTLLLQALVFDAAGEAGAALAALEQALRLAEPGGYIRLFIDEGEEIRLLIDALRLKIGKNDPQLMVYTGKLMGAYSHPTSVVPPQSEISNQQSTIIKQKSTIIEPLTPRELEVLRLLVTHMTTTEMAEVLYVAPSTVRTHIKSLYGKLEVNRRTDAVERARDLGLL